MKYDQLWQYVVMQNKLAAIHHLHHNKHHLEYCYDSHNKQQIDMPYKYAVEMVCDKIAAAKCYIGKEYTNQTVLDYWLKKRDKEPTNEKMKAFFDKVFTDLVSCGDKQVLNKKYLKQTYNECVLNDSNKG